MPDRPYRRTCRQFTDGTYAEGGKAQYIEHPKFALDPAKYVRSFLLIQKDLQELFEYIDPDDQNRDTYSFRTHALLMRTCIEVEANLKAILLENGYPNNGKLSMLDYRKVEQSHLLSGFEISIPFWRGPNQVRTPFAAWASGGQLPWYQTYNATKHDRHGAFAQATFGQLMDAVCGLVALLSSQFYTNSFQPGPGFFLLESAGWEHCIGDYFHMQLPQWPQQDRYGWSSEEWQRIVAAEPDPFRAYPYPPP